MKRRRTRLSFLALAMLIGMADQTVGGAVFIESQVGDIDGFSPGDSADVPFRSADIIDSLNLNGFVPFKDLDDRTSNFGGPGYTHSFSIPEGFDIVGATLTVGINTEHSGVDSDYLVLDIGLDGNTIFGSSFGPRAQLGDQPGYAPQPFTTFEITLDLSAVSMRSSQDGPLSVLDLLPELADGEFNILLADDSGVDYSILTIEIIPEPTTLSLLSIGGLILLRRRRKWTETNY